MISHLKQYIIDRMTCSYKFGCIFLLCMVRYIFFGINVISTLSGLTFKNLEKMANKIVNVPNHLKSTLPTHLIPETQTYLKVQKVNI